MATLAQRPQGQAHPGAVQPLVEIPPQYADVPGIGDLAWLIQPDGYRWGEVAADFQWDDAAAFLSPEGPRYHYLSRPRGGSKTSDLAALALVAMRTLTPGSIGYAVAADREQAARMIAMMWGYIGRMGWERWFGQARAWSVRQNKPRVAIHAISSDSSSSYGLLPAMLVVDEIHQWRSTRTARECWTAIVSAALKVPDCRLAVISTAGDVPHWTRHIRDHAVADPLWRANEVPGPVPWIAPEALAEQERLLSARVFQRLHLNAWTEGEDRLVSPGALRECVVLPGPSAAAPEHRYVMGLDIGLTHDRTAAVVMHLESGPAGGRVVLDLIRTWQGSPTDPVNLGDVAAWLAEVGERYNRATLVYDPHESAAVVQSLGWRPGRTQRYVFSPSSVGSLAQSLYGALRSRRLALYPDDPLLDELSNVRLVETQPNVFRLDHDSERHDDMVIALALAVQHLLARPPRLILRSVA